MYGAFQVISTFSWLAYEITNNLAGRLAPFARCWCCGSKLQILWVRLSFQHIGNKQVVQVKLVTGDLPCGATELTCADREEQRTQRGAFICSVHSWQAVPAG